MFSDFHFLHPHWLWALIPLALLLVYSRISFGKNRSNWEQVIAPELLTHLLVHEKPASQGRILLLPALVWLLAILALADPVWEKKPQQVFQTPRASVIILDLSASMNATDIKPSRLQRAKLKLFDILDRNTEGQTGLVVFAGDAFSVTPLTRDIDTIRSQIKVLDPDIMPVQGSRADLALLKAEELLQHAGVVAGDILLIADGYESFISRSTAIRLHQHGHRLSVLAVGTTIGAPISNGQGDVIRDAQNRPVLARLDENSLKELAKLGGGRYSRIRTDNRDIDYLLDQPPLNLAEDIYQTDKQQSTWVQRGPWLTVLLIPLAALAFRRGIVMSWVLSGLLLSFSLPSTPAQASLWDDLWKTREQQAAEALQQGRNQSVEKLSTDPWKIGSALYRQHKYRQALEKFRQIDNAEGYYNLGNSLARTGKYQEAIEAYNKALEHQPDMQDALDNKAAVEAFLKQQKKISKTEKQTQQKRDQQQSKGEDGKQDQNSGQGKQSSRSDSSASEKPASSQSKNRPDQDSDSSKADKQQDNEGNAANNRSTRNHDKKPDQESSKADKPEDSSEENRQQNPDPDSKEKQPNQTDLAQQQTPKSNADDNTEFQPLKSEEQMAAEQWLRRIQDDPGLLLKRKFLYQYRQRGSQAQSQQVW